MKLRKLHIIFIGALTLSLFGFITNQEADAKLQSQVLVEYVNLENCINDSFEFKYKLNTRKVNAENVKYHFPSIIVIVHSEKLITIQKKISNSFLNFKEYILQQNLPTISNFISDSYLV